MDSKDAISRRELLVGVAAIGVVALTAAGGCSSNDNQQKKALTPSMSYGGGDEMAGRVLVGYATRNGSTVGVADAIGEALAQRGFSVDVKPVKELPAVDGYDAVVLGSAINGAAWLPEAMDFVEANRVALESVPVAGFCVHAMNTSDDEKATKKRLAYLDKVRPLVRFTDEGFFVGVGPDPKETSVIARWAFRAFGGDAEGDCRDWDAIRKWAESVELV